MQLRTVLAWLIKLFIIVGIIFIIAGTYFNYKFNQIVKENEIDTKKAH